MEKPVFVSTLGEEILCPIVEYHHRQHIGAIIYNIYEQITQLWKTTALVAAQYIG
jgi:hypothetical protein